jgi:hypothetical protein
VFQCCHCLHANGNLLDVFHFCTLQFAIFTFYIIWMEQHFLKCVSLLHGTDSNSIELDSRGQTIDHYQSHGQCTNFIWIDGMFMLP